ncbi:DUF6221 family protein [Amycolatopsis echigonensis]|uniref:Uncharacterized protein n=1 Tax=Amycolatopsis echigonensis TaxID=2576905 RepID=A0A8E1W9D0_9PSEU|nr:DUF6221 family protein [Amycolatopsis echigonensis]MBB2506022.1 hypothetical protein [Amycolatopsis echigonensis]
MDDLIAFLRARLNEEDSAAMLAEGYGLHGPWQPGQRMWIDGEAKYYHSVLSWSQHGAAHVILIHGDNGTVAAHIARFGPDRVRREVCAKRQIIDEHGPETRDVGGWQRGTETICRTCRYDDGLDTYPYGRCPTIRLLALAYADHPDYRQEWRP